MAYPCSPHVEDDIVHSHGTAASRLAKAEVVHHLCTGSEVRHILLYVKSPWLQWRQTGRFDATPTTSWRGITDKQLAFEPKSHYNHNFVHIDLNNYFEYIDLNNSATTMLLHQHPQHHPVDNIPAPVLAISSSTTSQRNSSSHYKNSGLAITTIPSPSVQSFTRTFTHTHLP
eukprot:917433-Amphidinium_carterae.1